MPDRMRYHLMLTLLGVTVMVQVGLSTPKVLTHHGVLSVTAFVLLGAVILASGTWILRKKAIPAPVAAVGTVVVLTAAGLAGLELPPGDYFGDQEWAFGLAGWHLMVLLADRTAWLLGALGVNVAITIVEFVAVSPLDRAEIGGAAIVLLSVTSFQLLVLLLVRWVHRRAAQAEQIALERDRLELRKALAEEHERDQRLRFAGQLGAVLPLLAGLADSTLDPRAEDVRHRCTLAATQLRRLFAENDDVPDPLVHELSSCVDLAGRRGLAVSLAVSGEAAPVPTEIRRALTAPVIEVLAVARSHAKVSLLRTGEQVRVAVVTDGGPGAEPLTTSPEVTVDSFGHGSKGWTEAKWQRRH